MEINIYKKTILEILDQHRSVYSSEIVVPGIVTGNKKHKYNLIGHGGFDRGDIEHRLRFDFSTAQRQQASKAFDELLRDGYIEPTFDDTVDPEKWVTITDRGSEWLCKSLKDHVDECLEKIGTQLPELRRGMWDALGRSSPDSYRQAAHSARELIDQLLKEGAPVDLKTRKQRITVVMERFRGQKSKSDIEIIDANCRLIEAEHDKLLKLAHSRVSVTYQDVHGSIEAAERILGLIFGSNHQNESIN